MNIQEQNDMHVIGDLLSQSESIIGDGDHQMLLRLHIATEIFRYLCEHPDLIHSHANFCNVVMAKMAELYEATEEWKEKADPEGGERDDALLHDIAEMQDVVQRLQEQL